MQGTRRHADADGDLWLKPGEYGWDPGHGGWVCVTPNDHMGDLCNHEVTEHEDGTITVRPSIRVHDGSRELWHGWLERGVWRQV